MICAPLLLLQTVQVREGFWQMSGWAWWIDHRLGLNRFLCSHTKEASERGLLSLLLHHIGSSSFMLLNRNLPGRREVAYMWHSVKTLGNGLVHGPLRRGKLWPCSSRRFQEKQSASASAAAAEARFVWFRRVNQEKGEERDSALGVVRPTLRLWRAWAWRDGLYALEVVWFPISVSMKTTDVT